MQGNLNWIICLIALSLSSCTADRQEREGTASQNANMGFIELDGSKLAYKVEGEGIPCLVIGSSVYYPKTFSAEVRKHLKMYFVDLKWFAKEYKPQSLDSLNIRTIVADVEAIRSELQLDDPLIMGHSIHGTIAMEYAKKHADKISGLIIIGSPTAWGSTVYDQHAEALWQTASPERKALQEKNWGNTSELDRLTGQEEASARYNNMSPQYWYDPYYDATWLWDDMTVHSELTQHLFTEVFADYEMFDFEQSLDLPVLVMHGKYDFVIPYTLWQTSYSQLPDFTLQLFEKSGHTPQIEDQTRFDQSLFDWLSQYSF